jgi:hypothetical protein
MAPPGRRIRVDFAKEKSARMKQERYLYKGKFFVRRSSLEDFVLLHLAVELFLDSLHAKLGHFTHFWQGLKNARNSFLHVKV